MLTLGLGLGINRRGASVRPVWAQGDVHLDFENDRAYTPSDGLTDIAGVSGFSLNSATLSSGLVVGGGSPSLVLASQGITFPLTIVVAATSGASYSGFPRLYQFYASGGGSEAARGFYNANASPPALIIRQDNTGGSSTAQSNLGSIPAQAAFLVAASHSSSVINSALNGSGATATPTEALPALDTLAIGHFSGANQWPDTIKRLTIYAGIRSQAELEALTT